jgi:hypothetical protein
MYFQERTRCEWPWKATDPDIKSHKNANLRGSPGVPQKPTKCPTNSFVDIAKPSWRRDILQERMGFRPLDLDEKLS